MAGKLEIDKKIMDKPLPNLIIACVTKAGTTSLFTYMVSHPHICCSSIKEVSYFLPLRWGSQLLSCLIIVLTLRPLQNAPFCPISALDSNFKPRNTQSIPTVKIFALLELEQT